MAASSALLRLSSEVLKRRVPKMCASELINSVPCRSAVVLTKKPQTKICAPDVPRAGHSQLSRAPKPKSSAPKTTGTIISKRLRKTSSGYFAKSPTAR
jgi:hypothetical protein